MLCWFNTMQLSCIHIYKRRRCRSSSHVLMHATQLVKNLQRASRRQRSSTKSGWFVAEAYRYVSGTTTKLTAQNSHTGFSCSASFAVSRYFYMYIYSVYTVISVYVGPSVRMCVCMYVCMYTDPEYV